MLEKLKSWLETREIRADPELMDSLRAGFADMEAGRLTPIEDVAEELGIDLTTGQDTTRE